MKAITKSLGILLVGVLATLTAGVSTAQAAKGVKKKGEHRVHGIVVGVDHDKNGGSITVKTHHHKKKKKTATTTVGQKPKGKHEHKFHVSKGTHFSVGHGKHQKPASFGAVHKGEHVVILAKGHNAEKVTIHHHHKKKGKKTVTK